MKTRALPIAFALGFTGTVIPLLATADEPAPAPSPPTASAESATARLNLAGDVTFSIDEGSNIKIANESPFPLGGPDMPSSLEGHQDAFGAFSFASDKIRFSPTSVSAIGIKFKVQLLATSNGVGTFVADSGELHLAGEFRVKISAPLPFFPDKCEVAPVATTLSTEAPGGVRFDPITRRVTVVDDQVAIPAAQNCGAYTGTINSKLGLPAPAGANKIVMVLSSDVPLSSL